MRSLISKILVLLGARKKQKPQDTTIYPMF
jgi:hypothetical protein